MGVTLTLCAANSSFVTIEETAFWAEKVAAIGGRSVR